MKKQNSVIYHIVVFTLAQLAWFSLLTLWIYWYVSNYMLLSEVGKELSTKFISESTHIGALVSGIILLIVISIAMSLIFIYLNRQVSITRFYDNFIANVTHELKSPLSSIQLYLETMNQRQIPASTRKEFISMMLRDTERLDDLITSILDISGLEQKKIAYDYQVFTADDAIRMLIDEAVAEYKLDRDSVHIEGILSGQFVIDRRALKIVVNNLINNAIKYSNEALQLTVQLSTTAKYFFIEFCDRGIGISSKDQNKIFKKFQRIYNQNSPNVKGTGLGLYWVKEIISSHGGRIIVKSAGSYAGSTFRIELPIYPTSKKRYTNRLLKLARRRKKTTDSIDG